MHIQDIHSIFLKHYINIINTYVIISIIFKLIVFIMFAVVGFFFRLILPLLNLGI